MTKTENIHIAHISTVHSMYDDRIHYKECVSLAQEGMRVSLIIPSEKDETVDGVEVHALTRSGSRLSRVFKMPVKAYRKAMKLKANVYHFHDPELMFLGVALKLSGKKVVYDVHEDLPKQVLYKPWISAKWLRSIMSVLIYIMEQVCSWFFDGIVAVTDDIAGKYKASKTVIVRNLPVIRISQQQTEGDTEAKATAGEKVVFIYAGGLTRVRGIREIVEAIARLGDKAELQLLGGWEDEAYEKECMQEKAQSNVRYLGYKTMPEVYQHIREADVGIAMLYPIKNYVTSLPVKAFEYMLMKKPILMSDFSYWKKVFDGAATFADPYNVDEIYSKAKEYAENATMRQAYGEHGYKRVQEELNWEKEVEKLLSLYQRIVANAH